MLEWVFIIIPLLLGITLIVVEVIFVPGTTVVGLLGVAFTGYGIFLSYDQFGTYAGHSLLAGSIIICGGLTIFSFKSGLWTKFSLKKKMKSKVNEGMTDTLKIGDVGKAMSSLRPIGNVDFEGKTYEVSTHGNYLESGSKVKIIKIEHNKIIVEPI